MDMKKLMVIMFFLLVGNAWIGCSFDKKNDSNTIKIGVILPMTGELASYGAPMKVGLQMAQEELNKENSKYKFDLKFSDSKAEPNTAINALQKLLSIDNIRFFIGDVSSPVTLAIVPIIEKYKGFLLSPGASSPKLYNISPYFARNYPSSVAESKASAEFLFNEKKINSVAIIYVNSEYGIGLKEMFEKTFIKLGGVIKYSEAYKVNKRDFKGILTKLKSEDVKAIYLGGNQKEMGIFIKQLRELEMNPIVVSNISFLQPDCLNIAGKAANGVIVPVAYYNPDDSTMTNAHKFAQKYYKKFNKNVTIPVAVGYEALMLIADGVHKFGNSTEKVAEYIRNLKNYDGALGVLNFTNGDVNMPIEFKEVINGKTKRILIK
jgi:branched-chain amino acid transport system substrate-binding protein